MAIPQSFGVYQRVHRFGDERIGQALAAQRAQRERFDGIQQTGGRDALAQGSTPDHGDLFFRGDSKDFRTKLRLRFDVFVDRAGGHTGLQGNRTDGERIEAAGRYQMQGGIEQPFFQRRLARRSLFGGPVSHRVSNFSRFVSQILYGIACTSLSRCTGNDILDTPCRP